MKHLFIILNIIACSFLMGCQERGQPAKIPYVFRIIDSTGNNIVGDSLNPNRYIVDSIKYYLFAYGHPIYPGNYMQIKFDYYKGYSFTASTDVNVTSYYLLRYNSLEDDTLKVVYGMDNINVYKNDILIFSKYNLSQVPPVEFNIIK